MNRPLRHSHDRRSLRSGKARTPHGREMRMFVVPELGNCNAGMEGMRLEHAYAA